MKNQLQQGDVTLEMVTEIPVTAKEQKDESGIVLALGEVTGHAHRVKGRARLFVDGNGVRFLETDTETELIHDTNGSYIPGVNHEPVKLPKAIFRIGQINEMDHIEKAARKVID